MSKQSFRKAVQCYAYGEDGRWCGFCPDFDIAVEGQSFQEIKNLLREAISSYIEDALNESESDCYRLLRRRAPWHVRANFALKYAWHALRHRPDRKDGGDMLGFDALCAA